MAADALAPCITKTSAKVSLTMQDERTPAFWRISTVGRKMMENYKFLCMFRKIKHDKG